MPIFGKSRKRKISDNSSYDIFSKSPPYSQRSPPPPYKSSQPSYQHLVSCSSQRSHTYSLNGPPGKWLFLTDIEQIPVQHRPHIFHSALPNVLPYTSHG